MSAPKVSVIVPVYNAARYIKEAIGSLQAQSFSDFEIIAVDDGSSDASKTILERMALNEPRLRVISRPNTGIVGALNDALAVAQGEFIARMDADDIAMPTRFAQQLDYLQAHPDCVALGTDVLYTDPSGLPLIRHRPALAHDAIVRQLVDANGGAIIHPTLMARREAIERIGRYRPETLNFLEDLDLYLRLSEIGKLANLPEVFLHYRQHLKSINRMPGPRDAVRQKVVNPYRRSRGLPEFGPMPDDPNAPRTADDWYRHWAYEAIRGSNWRAARKNAFLACFAGPGTIRNWQCLKYVWTCASLPRTLSSSSMTEPRA
jgi:glycosyltransferase involved in cell wall biosynthesis